MVVVSKDFDIPFASSCHSDYIAELKNYFNNYKHFANTILNDLIKENIVSDYSKDTYTGIIDIGINKILSILNFYRYGNREKMHPLFLDLMNNYKPFIERTNNYTDIPRNTYFYRIRFDKGILDDKAKNPMYAVFHIPFNKRYLVNNLRYNPHGIPCLYCSNNLKTAWIETNRPQIDKDFLTDNILNAAIFSISNNINCIDFSLSSFNELYSAVIKNNGKVSKDLSTLLTYISLFPLISSLHTKVVDYNVKTSFSVEYIIPTILMDWLYITQASSYSYFNGNKISAIKYSSVQDNNADAYNYVFPSNFKEGELYCSYLESLFLRKYKYYYSDDISTNFSTTVDEAEIIKIQEYMKANLVSTKV